MKHKRPVHKGNRHQIRPNTVGNFLLIVITIVVIDQVTKFYANKGSIVKNEGIIFGLSFPSSNQIMIGASIAAIIILSIFILFVHLQGKKLYSAIVGGVIGNLIDRIQYGYVVDWIRVGNFPVFNVADAAISVSVILLIIYSTWAGSMYRRNRDRFMNRLSD